MIPIAPLSFSLVVFVFVVVVVFVVVRVLVLLVFPLVCEDKNSYRKLNLMKSYGKTDVLENEYYTNGSCVVYFVHIMSCK